MNTGLMERKSLVETVLYILNKTGGVDIYHVLKILYFAEQKHLATWGGRMTGCNYVAYKYGPVAEDLYNALRENHKSDPELRNLISEAVCYGGEDASSVIFAKREADTDYISLAARECLDASISENSQLTFSQLKNKSHDAAWEHAYSSGGVIDPVSMAKAGNADEAMLEYIAEQCIVDQILA